MKNYSPALGIAPLAIVVAACNPAAAVKAQLPEGETDLSCAAVIYAAKNIYADEATGTDFPDYLAVMTKYATRYAEQEGITDGGEAFQRVKLEAMKMAGELPNATQTISAESSHRRAAACYNS